MNTDKILEFARRFGSESVQYDEIKFTEIQLIAFAQSVIDEERERIRARVMQAAVKSWHGDDLAIGVPYVRLKAFANALLEEE